MNIIVNLTLGCVAMLAYFPSAVPDGMSQYLLSAVDLRDVLATLLGLWLTRRRARWGV